MRTNVSNKWTLRCNRRYNFRNFLDSLVSSSAVLLFLLGLAACVVCRFPAKNQEKEEDAEEEQNQEGQALNFAHLLVLVLVTAYILETAKQI